MLSIGDIYVYLRVNETRHLARNTAHQALCNVKNSDSSILHRSRSSWYLANSTEKSARSPHSSLPKTTLSQISLYVHTAAPWKRAASRKSKSRREETIRKSNPALSRRSHRLGSIQVYVRAHLSVHLVECTELNPAFLLYTCVPPHHCTLPHLTCPSRHSV